MQPGNGKEMEGTGLLERLFNIIACLMPQSEGSSGNSPTTSGESSMSRLRMRCIHSREWAAARSTENPPPGARIDHSPGSER